MTKQTQMTAELKAMHSDAMEEIETLLTQISELEDVIESQKNWRERAIKAEHHIAESMLRDDAKLNSISEDVLEQALAMLDKAIRRGLEPREIFWDVIDMMHDWNQEEAA